MLILLLLSRSVFSQNPHGDALKLDCAACHLSDSWSIPTSFWDNSPQSPQKPPKNAGVPAPTEKKLFHHDDTGFSLQGGHAKTDCRACHNTLVFSEAQPDCISCHTDVHRMTVGDDCSRCHTANSWLVDDVAELHLENGFPLVGAHATANCNACHISDSRLEFNRIGNDCISCHGNDFAATTNPNHTEAGFPTNCESCHTQDAWTPAAFDHDNFYPLLGAHATIANDCAACHHGDYTNTPNTCAGCHTTDYNNTTGPNHTEAGFSTNCESCHTQDAWTPAAFDHDNFYPLLGAHATIANDCAACHHGDYTNTPNTCAGCHTTDYNNTTGPNHTEAGFSTNCESCHTQDAWTPAAFDHDNFYPLLGAHATIANDCAACHHGDYTNTPNTCAGCHTSDYNNTTNPNHEAAHFPTNCESCHTQDAWIPAAFDHDNFYPLLGAHATIANNCIACHVGSNYTNTPNTCFGCHSQDYNGANDPNHQSAGFPTNCESCHSQTSWSPSTFNHDGMYFPIYSGNHNNEWDNCIECHTTPGNFSMFSCIDCHEHDNPGSLANDHQGVNGYIYQSSACYACHPDGED